MNKGHTYQQAGFTLIETLVYLALYTIIIGGALAAAYSMFESSAHNETIAMVEEEGDYLVAKIDWALSSAVSIQLPSHTGSILSVTDTLGSTITLWNMASMLVQQKDSNPKQTLNNSNVSVVRLTFLHTLGGSSGYNPESVSASFTLFATTSDGHVLSRDFSTLHYLHK